MHPEFEQRLGRPPRTPDRGGTYGGERAECSSERPYKGVKGTQRSERAPCMQLKDLWRLRDTQRLNNLIQPLYLRNCRKRRNKYRNCISACPRLSEWTSTGFTSKLTQSTRKHTKTIKTIIKEKKKQTNYVSRLRGEGEARMATPLGSVNERRNNLRLQRRQSYSLAYMLG